MWTNPYSLLQGSADTEDNISSTDHYLQVVWHLLVLCHYADPQHHLPLLFWPHLMFISVLRSDCLQKSWLFVAYAGKKRVLSSNHRTCCSEEVSPYKCILREDWTLEKWTNRVFNDDSFICSFLFRIYWVIHLFVLIRKFLRSWIKCRHFFESLYLIN